MEEGAGTNAMESKTAKQISAMLTGLSMGEGLLIEILLALSLGSNDIVCLSATVLHQIILKASMVEYCRNLTSALLEVSKGQLPDILVLCYQNTRMEMEME